MTTDPKPTRDATTNAGQRWLDQLTRDVRATARRRGKATTRKQGDR